MFLFFSHLPWLIALLFVLFLAGAEQLGERPVTTAQFSERNRLEGAVYANLYRRCRLTGTIALHSDLDQETFARILRPLGDGNPLRNIAAATDDLVIHLIYPLTGNVGLDYRQVPSQWDAALRPRDTAQPSVAGPLLLVQGGIGIMVCEPVFFDPQRGKKRFGGLISAVMDAEVLYQRAGLRDPDLGLEIALRNTDGSGTKGEVLYGDCGLFANEPVILEATLPGGSWQLAAIPADGWQRLTTDSTLTPLLALVGGLVAFWILASHVQYRKRAEHLRTIRMVLLEGLLAKRQLPELLDHLAQSLETLRPKWRVSILQLKDGKLYTIAAPSLPDFYNAAIDGLEAKEGFGSCGTAGATGQTVIVENVYQHPYWTSYRELARKAGFRACWSVPFKNSRGEVLGSFAVYYDRARRPSKEEQTLIEEFAHLAALAVEQTAAESHLRQAEAAFNYASEGIMITDSKARILAVNPAFCQITGYSQAEVLGKKESLLQSGHHDRAFYRKMWRCLVETGRWEGEIWNRRKTGEVYPQLLTISAIRDAAGQPSHYVALMNDLSQLKQFQERLEYLTYYDSLTGLPNRLLLQLSLTQALERARRYNRQLAVLLLDVDHFNLINESLHHAAGDELLGALVWRLKAHLRAEDLLGRLAGDEFLLIVEDLPRPEAAAGVAEHLLSVLAVPFRIANQEIYLSASIGISLYPDDGAGASELIEHAETAMRQTKQEGRGGYRFYTATLAERARRRLELEARLRQALKNGDFLLHYQPLIELASGRIIGGEALVRWQDPEQGLIPPDLFIPLAEESGLILPLEEWVLTTACLTACTWLSAGLDLKAIAVNLSARHFRQPNLPEKIARILDQTGLPPACLKLEITESIVMDHGEKATSRLRELKSLGIKLSLDDFGTGYSSLAYLKNFPLDELKIDRSFVRDIPQDPSDVKITNTIIHMGSILGLKVVAEGVETAAQHEVLLQQGCHAAQGYFYSRPLPESEFSNLLHRSLNSSTLPA